MKDIKKLNKLILLLMAILLLALTSLKLTAQNIEQRLNKPSSNCEIVAINSQELLAKFELEQTDSIFAILDYWESICGNVEPIQRVKILLNISQNTYSDSAAIKYIDLYLSLFKTRIYDSKKENYYDFYERYSAYFSYVKLNGVFDNWTKLIALKLLDDQDEKSDQHLMCLLFLGQFEKGLKYKKYKDSELKKRISRNLYNYNSLGYSYTFYTGLWTPLSQRAKYFSPSPIIGFGLGVPFGGSMRFELKTIISIWMNKKELDFLINNDVVSSKYNAGVTLGGLVTKEVPVAKKDFIDVGLGINIASFSSGVKKESSDGKESTHSVTSVDVEIGIGYRRKIKSTSSVGFNISIHYAPMNFDKILVTDVGDWYVNSTLLYRY